MEQEKATQENSFAEDDVLEVVAPLKVSSSLHSAIEIESGDHLFFEDASQFLDVPIFKDKNPSKIERKTDKIKSDSSLSDYLNEIDQQYFGALKGKRVDVAPGLQFFFFLFQHHSLCHLLNTIYACVGIS